MDFVTHFPRTSQKYDTVWVIVYWLTKSAHFLAVWMTFTLDLIRRHLREGGFDTKVSSHGSEPVEELRQQMTLTYRV